MGGNALKNTTTRRYQRQEYLELEVELVLELQNLLGVMVWAIPAYKTKTDFGDLDLLVESNKLRTNWVDKVVEHFKPKEWVKNGPVLSFEYKEFQIDLILTPEHEMAAARNYFAYNDLGNLLGRVANQMGLKLGHKGLSYRWWVQDKELHAEHTLTTHWSEALRILGYEPHTYSEGFQTLEDIFEYVASSRFFSTNIFLLENRNHASRVRDAKRKTYTAFLDWCEANKDRLHSCEKQDKLYWNTYLQGVVEGFGELHAQMVADIEASKKFKAVYNGNVVAQVTGLIGKPLGEFMAFIRGDEPDLVKKVTAMNPEVVPRWIDFRYNEYKEIK